MKFHFECPFGLWFGKVSFQGAGGSFRVLHVFAKLKALQFTGLGSGKGGDKCDGSGVFVGRDLRLHKILELLCNDVIAGMPGSQGDIGVHNLATLFVCATNDRTFGHCRVQHQGFFNFRACDVVPGGHNHLSLIHI